MTTKNNRIVVDLNKIQWGLFYYVNQYGQHRYASQVKDASVRGVVAPFCELALYHPDHPKETVYERAKRLNLIDVWTPVMIFKLQANASLTYTGAKALELNRAWNAKQFGKKKGKK